MGQRATVVAADVGGDQRGDGVGGAGRDAADGLSRFLVAAGARPEQQQEGGVIVGNPLEVGPESLFGLLATSGDAGRCFGDRRQQAVADLVEQGHVQVLLGIEVLVQHGLGHSGGLGDVVHRRPVEAVAGEHFDGDVENLFAASGCCQTNAHGRMLIDGLPQSNNCGSYGESFYSPCSRSSRSAALTA